MKKTNFILVIVFSHIYLFPTYKPRKLEKSNEIIIKINGRGKQNVLNSEYEFKPDEILLNGNNSNIDEENKILILEKKKIL